MNLPPNDSWRTLWMCATVTEWNRKLSYTSCVCPPSSDQTLNRLWAFLKIIPQRLMTVVMQFSIFCKHFYTRFFYETVCFISCSSTFWPLGLTSPAHNPVKNLHMSDVAPPDLYRSNQTHKTSVSFGWICPQRCDVVTLVELQFHQDTVLNGVFGTTMRCDVRACDEYKTIQYVTFVSTLIYLKSKIFPHCWLIPLFLFLFLGCLWFPAWR